MGGIISECKDQLVSGTDNGMGCMSEDAILSQIIRRTIIGLI
jgi:hypothetical protein